MLKKKNQTNKQTNKQTKTLPRTFSKACMTTGLEKKALA
jgi:hypothetical protein